MFGPPSTIDALQTSPLFQEVSLSVLPDGVAVHAPHLPPVDVEAVLGDSPILDTMLPSNRQMSLSKKTFFRAETLGDLLRATISEMSEGTIWLEDSVEKLCMSVKDSSKLKLVALGPTTHTAMLHKCFKRSVNDVQIVRPQGQTTNPENSSSDFAIVGMSGRFPQCESVEEFWECLMNGVDTCEEVCIHPQSSISLTKMNIRITY